MILIVWSFLLFIKEPRYEAREYIWYPRKPLLKTDPHIYNEAYSVLTL